MALLIVFDFDGTITEKDTVDSLARFAVYYATTDSRSTTPTQDWPTSPDSHLPSPMLSASISSLEFDKVVIRLDPATEDKPTPVDERVCPVPEDGTIAGEPTPQASPTTPNVKSFQPSPSISIVKPFNDLTLSTAPQTPSPSISSVESLGGLTLSTANILSPTPSFISSTSLLDIWNFTLVEGYMGDVQKFESEYTPSEEKRLKWEDEEEFLEQLNAVELESMKRVESSPLFRKLYPEDFRRFGREAVRIGVHGSEPRPLVKGRPGPRGVELRPVKIRKGFHDFVRQASLDQCQLGLVSINWSQEFIEGVLDVNIPPVEPVDDEGLDKDITNNATDNNKNGSHPSTEMDLDEYDSDGDLSQIVGEDRLDTPREKFARIVANHIGPDGNIDGPSTGMRPIITAKDKETAFGRLKDDLGGWDKSVYIGDSRTDLLCLRDADLGIAIATDPDQSGLVKTLRRLTGDIPHVSEAAMTPGTKLAWARDFEEILQSNILDGLSR